MIYDFIWISIYNTDLGSVSCNNDNHGYATNKTRRLQIVGKRKLHFRITTVRFYTICRDQVTQNKLYIPLSIYLTKTKMSVFPFVETGFPVLPYRWIINALKIQ